MSDDYTPIKTILILAANPQKTSRLRLDEEVREIDLGLQRSQKREQFILKQQWAVRPRDVYRAMLDYRPQIIHFCGHGDGNEGLALEDENGEIKLVNGEALANLFQLFAVQLECVLLNSCYSEVQASAISQHIDYVIGMKKAIGDRAAIKFAVGFYDAISANESYDFAFNLGCRAIQIAGIAEQFIPVIKKRVTMNDERLRKLINDICTNPDPNSSKRRRAINRLLIELQKPMPEILKSSHPYYLEALDKTWEWLSQNICTFKPRAHLSLQKSLTTWINGYLTWRIRDLYRSEHHQYLREQSLDVDINENDENPSSLRDKLSKTGIDTPTLDGLDAYLEKLRKKKIQEVFERFERYVEEDPEMLLRNCHPRQHPHCNCQLLCKKRFFKDPPEKFLSIARELNTERQHQNVRNHWQKKCLPLLQQILKNLGYSEDEES